MLAACPVHPKGIMVIPMLWRIHGYVVCVLGVKNQKHHTHPYRWLFSERSDVFAVVRVLCVSIRVWTDRPPCVRTGRSEYSSVTE